MAKETVAQPAAYALRKVGSEWFVERNGKTISGGYHNKWTARLEALKAADTRLETIYPPTIDAISEEREQ